jgi:hypothetical protein
MNRFVIVCATILPALLSACGSDDSNGNDRLARFRGAIPSKEQLEMDTPSSVGGARDVGDPAEYPGYAVPVALQVNGLVVAVIEIMHRIVDLPPTVYNSDTKEYFWGLWDRDDGEYGKAGAYIRENPAGSDFQFSYALLRAESNDVATWSPVIWGGANPDADNEDYGSGALLFDFEANHAWEQEFNPDYTTRDSGYTRGRFAAVYARGAAEDDPNAEVTWNVARIANFAEHVAPNAVDFASGDADYLYGRYENGVTVSFIDFSIEGDIDGTPESVETLDTRLAFLNEGMGRGEVWAEGGAITEGDHIEGLECWNTQVKQTHKHVEYVDAVGTRTDIETPVATEADCGLVFTSSLDELSIPSLAQVWTEHPDLQTALYDVTENGIPAE